MQKATDDSNNVDNIFNAFQWKQKSCGIYKLSSSNESNNEDTQAVSKKPGGYSNAKQDTQKDIQNVLDNSEKFRVEMLVMTEWGPGKITQLNEDFTATVKIEGTDVPFPLSNLNTALCVYCCILNKDITYWSEMRVNFADTVMTLKAKIGLMVNCHPSQVVIVHGGNKVDTNVGIFELGLYEKDTILAVIKDMEEYTVMRTNTHKTSNNQLSYNSIRFITNANLSLTGIGFYKNCSTDISYDLLILEEDVNNNLRPVYSEKKISVKCEDAKENPILKHKLSNIEIKDNVWYEIHQYLLNGESNQYTGFKCFEQVDNKASQVCFRFANNKIQGKTNTTTIEEGMIPMLNYFLKV